MMLYGKGADQVDPPSSRLQKGEVRCPATFLVEAVVHEDPDRVWKDNVVRRCREKRNLALPFFSPYISV